MIRPLADAVVGSDETFSGWSLLEDCVLVDSETPTPFLALSVSQEP